MEALLGQLESYIKSLLDKHTQLQQAHKSLKENQDSLVNERKSLQEKNQVAIAQIEKMIDRLKLLEGAT